MAVRTPSFAWIRPSFVYVPIFFPPSTDALLLYICRPTAPHKTSKPSDSRPLSLNGSLINMQQRTNKLHSPRTHREKEDENKTKKRNMNLKCTPRRTDRHYLCIVPSSGPHQLTHGPAMHLLDEECRWILLDASTRIAHTNQQHNTNESEDWAHRTVARARSQESRAFAAKSKAARTCWVTANEQKSIFFFIQMRCCCCLSGQKQ